MNGKEFIEELLYPLRSSTTLVALITFYILLGLADLAGLFGIWLLVMVVPALFRYLVFVAQARARGTDAVPPGIEYFSLVGNAWTLFPVLPAILFTLGLRVVLEWGDAWIWFYCVTCASLYPAMIAVLVITHSPLQAINPLGWYRLVNRVGSSYLFGPALLIGIGLLPAQIGVLAGWAQAFLNLYLSFAFYAVVGATIRDEKLIEEVDIPEAIEPDAEKQYGDLLKQRTGVLTHAYGFASRGNRDGAFQHIEAWLSEDPDPDAAWPWFFENMLKWEQSVHALFFAQRYLSRLLARGETVPAVKLMLRGRLLDDRFRPSERDLPAAIEAAESAGNQELAELLQRL